MAAAPSSTTIAAATPAAVTSTAVDGAAKVPVLNTALLQQLTPDKKQLELLRWLSSIEPLLLPANRDMVRKEVAPLMETLTGIFSMNPGPPLRRRAAAALVTVLEVTGNGAALIDTVKRSLALLKGKEESAQSAVLARLSVVESLGMLVERFGRQISQIAPEILAGLVKSAKSNEPQIRLAAVVSLGQWAQGFGDSAGNKDLFRCLRGALTDRTSDIKAAAARSLNAMATTSTYIQTQELDSTLAGVVKMFEGSTYEIRRAGAALVGHLLASTQDNATWANAGKAAKKPSFDDIFTQLAAFYVKGAGGEILLKGTASTEVRVGISEVYVTLFSRLGAVWVEKNIANVIQHVLMLSRQAKAISNATDALYAQQHMAFILVTALGRGLGQQGRINSIKELCTVIVKLLECSPSEGTDANMVSLISCLDVVRDLVELVGSPVLSISDTVILPLFSASIHPFRPVRYSAAACLRSLGSVLPGRASLLANQCLDRIEKFRSSADGVHGSAYSLAAVLGGSASCRLGLPNSLAANVMLTAEQLLAAAAQAPGQATNLASTEAGWVLMGSLTALGSAAISPYVARLVALWTEAFPEDKGAPSKDAAATRLAFQSRLGCLTCIHGFLAYCKELVTPDAQKLIVRCCSNALTWISDLSPQFKATPALIPLRNRLRARIYSVLFLVPQNMYEKLFAFMLPHLVADLTLTDTTEVNTTSLLRSLCHQADSVLLGSWNQEKDEKMIEDQLEEHSGYGLGELQNDPSFLFQPEAKHSNLPLPSEVTLVDTSIQLFGAIFPWIQSQKHRFQLLEHFAACIKTAKSGARRQAIQTNIFVGFLSALRGIAERKGDLGKERIVETARNLVLSALTNPADEMRCAAGEALGRMAQVVGGTFAADMVQASIEHLKSDRDANSRTGYGLALGCIYRYCGMADTSRHLQSAVGILRTLAGDASPAVQTWALHALMLTIDAAGYEFSFHVKPTLEFVTQALMTTPYLESRVHQCAGNVMSALITTVGPELQAADEERNTILGLSQELLRHPDAQAVLTGFHCMQQLILFTPRHVDIAAFIPIIEKGIASSHLVLRRACFASLRQLVQRQPDVARHYGQDMEARLFKQLDTENDAVAQSDIRETILNMLTAMCEKEPSFWLKLCNNVLSGADEREVPVVVEDVAPAKADTNAPVVVGDEDAHQPEVDDEEIGQGALQGLTPEQRVVVPTRWESKVFAVRCVRKVVEVCCRSSSRAIHLDVTLARQQPSGDFLVSRLEELIRTSFMSATSAIDQLRQVGLEALEDIIASFSGSRDPDIGGQHSLLEQYQAQVTSALRPAFESDTPPDVTATACRVCAAWIASGVNRNASDLQRLSRLLATRLEIIESPPDPAYNERASTLLRVGLLSSWASMFIAFKDREGFEYLKDILDPHLPRLASAWLAALKDFAYITLPQDYADQIPEEGHFYSRGSRTSVRAYYTSAFPLIVQAAGHTTDMSDNAPSENFFLLLGVSTRALCGRIEEPTAIACLFTIKRLVASSERLKKDMPLFLELLGILLHVMRVQGPAAKKAVVDVIYEIVNGNHKLGEQTEEIVPGHSIIYAILEICTSVLLRELPQLNPIYSSSTPIASLKPETLTLLGAAVDALSYLPDVCSANNSVQILPSMFPLLFGILKEGEGPVCPFVLKGLRRILMCKHRNDASVQAEWNSLLSTGLLCLADDAVATTIEDPSPLFLALGVYIGSLPELLTHPDLARKVLEALASGSRHSASQVRLTSTQAGYSVLAALPRSTARAIILAVLPAVLQRLVQAGQAPPSSEAELKLLVETVRFAETACDYAEPHQLSAYLGMLLPLLVLQLQDPAPPVVSKEPAAQLHHLCLRTINTIGPKYPEAFRAVILSSPELRQRLEAAVRADAARAGQAARPVASVQQEKPKIQLKMDFSAFAAAAASSTTA